MSQLANCPLTEATLDRIATVENRLTIAPPNPLIRQMILLQLGFLIALISGVICVAIGIGLTVGLRTVSDQAGRLWKQHEFQVEQDFERQGVGTKRTDSSEKLFSTEAAAPPTLQEQFAALNAQRAKEEAAAKEQAEAAKIQAEQQTKTLQLEAERLDKLKAEQQRLDAQRAEAARLQKQEAESRRLLQQQSSQADPEMSRSYQSAQEASSTKSAVQDKFTVKCQKLEGGLNQRGIRSREDAVLTKVFSSDDFEFYTNFCSPGLD